MTLLARLLFLSVLAGCAPDATDLEVAGPDPAEVAALEDEAVAPTDTLVVLERRGCYGRCPVYRVEVDGGGTVRYVGERDVRTTGDQEWTVPRESVARLVAAAQALGHAELPTGLNHDDSSACTAIATDHSSATTTVRVAGREHRVHHDHGCAGFDRQDALEAFEDEIDRALGTERWVRG